MNYSEFKTGVLEEVQKQDFPEGTTFNITQVIKNNDTVLDGLVISEPGSNISPTIYLNQFYESGISIDAAAGGIHDAYSQHKLKLPFDVDSFMDFEKARENISFRLVSKERNAKLLEDATFVPFLDLAIVFAYMIQGDGSTGNGSIVIRNRHAKEWGVTAEELLQVAKENSKRILPVKFESMSDVLPMGAPEDNAMKVLTNKNMYYGAGVILYDGVLKDCAEQMGVSKLHILPSSIHEVILIPQEMGMVATKINNMISEINATTLSPDEILSDHLYTYDSETDKIEY